MIRIGGVPEHFNYPFRKGISDHFFSEQGMNIAWNEYPGGTGSMLEALKNDELDAAVLLTEGAFKAIEEGAPIKIAQMYVNSPLTWGVHTACNHKMPYDQETAPVFLISRPLSGSHLMAKIYHDLSKSTKEPKFEIVGNLQGALKHFRTKYVGYFLWERFTTDYYVQERLLERVDEIATPWSSFVLVFSEKAYQKNKELLEAVKHNIPLLCEKYSKDEATLRNIISMYELDLENAAQWYERLQWFTSSADNLKGLNDCYEKLIEFKVISNHFPLQHYII